MWYISRPADILCLAATPARARQDNCCAMRILEQPELSAPLAARLFILLCQALICEHPDAADSSRPRTLELALPARPCTASAYRRCSCTDHIEARPYAVSSALSGMLTATAPSFCIAHTRRQPSANRVTFGAAQVNMPGRAAAPAQLCKHLPQAQLIANWSTLGLHFRRPPPSVLICNACSPEQPQRRLAHLHGAVVLLQLYFRLPGPAGRLRQGAQLVDVDA